MAGVGLSSVYAFPLCPLCLLCLPTLGTPRRQGFSAHLHAPYWSTLRWQMNLFLRPRPPSNSAPRVGPTKRTAGRLKLFRKVM